MRAAPNECAVSMSSASSSASSLPAPSAVRVPACDHVHVQLQHEHDQSEEEQEYMIAVSPGPQHVPFSQVHSLQDEEKSPIFSLVCFRLSSGKEVLVTSCSQQGRLDLWDLSFFSRLFSLEGHSRQVTAVAVDRDHPDGPRLVSAARDGIRSWNLESRQSSLVCASYRGAVYCLCATHGWLLSGGQDTFVHAFEPGTNKEHVLRGHSGFVFALCAWGDKFFSAGGNGDLFLWEKSGGEPAWKITRKLAGHTGSVLNLAVDGESLYSVSRDGSLKIWDLDTFLVSRSLVTKKRSDMVAVSVSSNIVFAASSLGSVSAWVKPSLTYLGALRSDSRTPIVSLASSSSSSMLLFVAGSEGDIGVWQHDRVAGSQHSMLTSPSFRPAPPALQIPSSIDAVSSLLAQFVGFRTVSGAPEFRSDCFNGAKWLRNCFVKLGFDARLEQPSDESVNPIVYARMGDNPALKTVVMYAHYDVVSAGVGWSTDPFVLRGMNGYLYGRGTTDNKGPLLVAMLAVSQLAAAGKLGCNVRFIVEGEEENGSVGVMDSVARNTAYFGSPSLLLISNNYWIGEDRPCLIYGLRGVIYFSMSDQVSGPQKSNHSGVDGGAFREPMLDLMQLLSSLTDPASGRVLVPGFYDQVREVSQEERGLYDDIEFDLEKYSLKTGLQGLIGTNKTDLLMQRWRFPAFSVTSVDCDSGVSSATIIPASVTASFSIRTVPDQNHEAIIKAFETFAQDKFSALNSPNKLSLKVLRQGAWWLGDLKGNGYFASTSQALEKVWGVKPMFTREGGSIPILSKLEQALGVKGLILPIGLSTDNAHLANERVSLQALLKGMEVFKEIFGAME